MIFVISFFVGIAYVIACAGAGAYFHKMKESKSFRECRHKMDDEEEKK